MIVLLEWYEVFLAAEVGIQRQIAALRAHRPDRFGYDGLGWTEHIEGATGEMVVAKALDIYWSGSVDTFRGASDIAGRIEVKTRSRDEYELLVRPDDPDDSAFVLVVGRAPRYRIVGWLYGREAKRPEWLAGHGGRPPAYFVPQAELHPFETLNDRSLVNV